MFVHANKPSIPERTWSVLRVCVSALFLVGLCATVAVAQDTSHVHGVVFFKDIPSTLKDPTGSTSMWRLDTTLPDSQAPPLDLSQMRVVLVSDAADAKSFDPALPPIEISGYAIQPMVSVVPINTTVRFVNKGPVPVTLQVLERTIEPIHLGNVGDTGSLLLDKPGRYALQDINNASTIAYVVATQMTKTSGLLPTNQSNEATFDLGLLPQGSYTLRVYMRGKIVHTQEVRATKAKTPLKFLLTREELQRALP